MAVSSPYLFCTKADVETRLTAEGVRRRLDENMDGAVAPAEEQSMTDALSDASETILFYLWHKYAPSVLQTSAWVNRRCVDLAALVFCCTAGGGPPDSVIARAEKAEKQLEEVHAGSKLVPALPLRSRLAPAWSNVRIVPGYRFKCIRVEEMTSSPRTSGKVPVNPDWEAQVAVEL